MNEKYQYRKSNNFRWSKLFKTNIYIKHLELMLFVVITDCNVPTLANAYAYKEVVKHNETVTYFCDDAVGGRTLTFVCNDGTVDIGEADCRG